MAIFKFANCWSLPGRVRTLRVMHRRSELPQVALTPVEGSMGSTQVSYRSHGVRLKQLCCECECEGTKMILQISFMRERVMWHSFSRRLKIVVIKEELEG